MAILFVAALSVPTCCAAQDAAPPASASEQSVATQALAAPSAAAEAPQKGFYRDGWKQLGPDVVRDQKPIWLFPISAARGHRVKATLALVGVTGALIGVDKYITGYFNDTKSFDGFNRVFSGPNMALATEVIPASLFAVGLARRDKYAQETFFLAGRAVIDVEILTSVMKDIDRRSIPANGDYSDTWFNRTGGYKSYITGNGSFPSGHTIAAFAVATAYAERYPNPAWHRWAAYGLAGLIGFSRVSLHAHYASDVFAGAALGYAITRYAVVKPQ